VEATVARQMPSETADDPTLKRGSTVWSIVVNPAPVAVSCISGVAWQPSSDTGADALLRSPIPSQLPDTSTPAAEAGTR
jgi:hypothetical protein